PMLLVDEIVEEVAGQSISCRRTFRAEEFFFQGHFPDRPIVPGVIQCECCLQAGAVLLAGNGEMKNRLPVATRIDGVKFKRMIEPGETADIAVELKEQVSNAFYLTGKLSVGGKLATRLDFTVTLSSLEG
ncbi:MAG: 3-hydroxyacyl-ACP dehydratase FabZ family protein, partial [Planctomycetota bacterium]